MNCRCGSALIMTVVLTVLLAVIGMMFVMFARIDKMATSAIAENKELQAAVDTVIEKISEVLIQDVPGSGGGPNIAEYFDYPGPNDEWLANLEPIEYQDEPNIYYWRHISDLYGVLNTYDINDSNDRDGDEDYISAYNLNARVIADHEANIAEGEKADADGDGVADSRWVELVDMTTAGGRRVFAAVRIIDNGAMLNVNTGFKFDPDAGDINLVDGSSQMQINLMALSWRPLDPCDSYELSEETDLLDARAGGVDSNDLDAYEDYVIWLLSEPAQPYTPFDISDELELRYRFLLNHPDIDTRLESWGGEFRRKGVLKTPLTSGGKKLERWFRRACYDGSLDPNYDYRHIATMCNIDRIIDPNGSKMVNVNTTDVNSLYSAIVSALSIADTNAMEPNAVAAQLTVNIIDFCDEDANITVFEPNDGLGVVYYGFESPCVYISELTHRFKDANSKSYAVELYKPYDDEPNLEPNDWRLVVGGNNVNIDNWTVGKFYVIRNADPCAPLDVNSSVTVKDDTGLVFQSGTVIQLQRIAAGQYVTVDEVNVPDGIWLVQDGNEYSIERDIGRHRCIRRLWNDSATPPSLGSTNSFTHPDANVIQAHPANKDFVSIGDIEKVFRVDASIIEPNHSEADVRLDLQNPAFRNIFQYLTVMDPAGHGLDLNETRIKGRININTAPWFVMAQLPWMTDEIAQAIVSYRDKLTLPGVLDYNDRADATGIENIREDCGFESIGELNFVIAGADEYREYRIDKYARDFNDLEDFPDLTYDDGAIDDFEERDVIFARISNLVTVRSDVFTAYILVRLGTDGPQKRVIAIVDRSNVYSSADKVKIVALYPVPDPR